MADSVPVPPLCTPSQADALPAKPVVFSCCFHPPVHTSRLAVKVLDGSSGVFHYNARLAPTLHPGTSEPLPNQPKLGRWGLGARAPCWLLRSNKSPSLERESRGVSHSDRGPPQAGEPGLHADKDASALTWKSCRAGSATVRPASSGLPRGDGAVHPLPPPSPLAFEGRGRRGSGGPGVLATEGKTRFSLGAGDS